MKKIILTLLILLLFPISSNAVVLWTSDFESDTTGWTNGAGSTLAWARTALGLDSSSLKLSRLFDNVNSSDDPDNTAARVVGVTSGTMEALFTIETHSTIANRGMVFGLGNNPNANLDIAIYFRVFGAEIQYYDGSSWNTGVSVTASTEYVIKVAADVTAHTYDVYIGNMVTPIATDVTFWNDVALGYIFFDSAVTASGGAPLTEFAKFDNVTVQTTGDSLSVDPFGFAVLPIRLNTLASSDKTRTGTYTGIPTAIEGRIVQAGTSTPLTGFDWQTFDASPTGGTFSGTWTGVPDGGLYEEQYRFSNDTGITVTGSTQFSAGLVVGHTGQSLEQQMFSLYSTLTPTDSRMFTYDQSGLQTLATGDGAVSFANTLRSLGFTGDIVLLNHAEDGAGLVADSVTTNKYWLYNTDYSNGAVWLPFVDSIDDVGGDLSCISWDQGQREARSGSTVAAQYQAAEPTLFSRIRTETHAGIPIFTSLLGKGQAVTDVAVDFETVRDAKITNRNADANIYSINYIDQTLAADGFDIHIDNAGYIRKGILLAYRIADIAGLVANSTGPIATAAGFVDSTTIEIVFTLDGGATILPATGITGIEIEVDGAWETPITGATSGTTATFTHSAGTATKVRGLYGNDPTTTGIIKDDTAQGFLLDPFELNVAVGPIPNITILSPTSDPTYSTATASINISGASTITSGSVASVVITSDRGGGPYTPTGTTSWSQESITIFSGVNILTATATSDLGEEGVDTLTVTYTTPNVTLTIEGGPFIYDGQSYSAGETIGLPDGANTITVSGSGSASGISVGCSGVRVN